MKMKYGFSQKVTDFQKIVYDTRSNKIIIYEHSKNNFSLKETIDAILIGIGTVFTVSVSMVGLIYLIAYFLKG